MSINILILNTSDIVLVDQIQNETFGQLISRISLELKLVDPKIVQNFVVQSQDEVITNTNNLIIIQSEVELFFCEMILQSQGFVKGNDLKKVIRKNGLFLDKNDSDIDELYVKLLHGQILFDQQQMIELMDEQINYRDFRLIHDEPFPKSASSLLSGYIRKKELELTDE